MPTLNIKDPEVYRLARELADERHTSMTEVVRSALIADREAHPPPRLSYEERMRRIRDIQERVAADVRERGDWFLSDDDVYDEMGLPK